MEKLLRITGRREVKIPQDSDMTHADRDTNTQELTETQQRGLPDSTQNPSYPHRYWAPPRIPATNPVSWLLPKVQITRPESLSPASRP